MTTDDKPREVATIFDVAARAGVSPSTVSRHLMARPVRKAEDIAAAVAELDFRPSVAARTLKSGRTGSIALVVPDVTNPFFAAVVKGAEAIARRSNYTACLYNTDESSDREQEILTDLVGRVDGVILAPAIEQDSAPIVARNAGLPIVLLDRETDASASFDTVLVDNIGGSRAAAKYLLGLGHERIGIIHGPLASTPGRQRHEGFLSVLAEHDIDVDPRWVHEGGFRQDGGYQAMLRLLASVIPPTAVFIANNVMTIGALHALRDMSVQVPREMSMLGFDDHSLAPLLSPALTVVQRPMEEQGVLAMRLLLNRLSGAGPRAAQRIVLDTHLLIRDSCAEPPAAPKGTRPKSRATPPAPHRRQEAEEQ